MVGRSPEVDRRSVLAAMLGLAALGAVPALSGCSRQEGGPGPVDPAGMSPVAYHAAREQVTVAAAAHLDAVVEGMRAFAQDLHRVSATAQANWTASPLSIACAVIT